MRSMHQALFWETLSHGRWSLPGLFLLGNALPLLVYGFLSGMSVNTADPAFVVLQFAFMPLTILQFAIGIAMAQGPMSRLYALPVSSNAIVAWHTLSGAVILALETAFAACLYNSLFHVGWPIVGPMLFAAAVWSALQLLQFVPSQPSLSGMCLASGPLFALLLWIQSRYGSWLSPPKHYWREVTISDGVTLVMAVLIHFGMATVGVRFARCSEPLPRLGVSKWLIHQWERLTLGRQKEFKFRSASEAQKWYEFRLKGWAFPFLSAIAMSLALFLVVFGAIVVPSKLNGIYDFIFALGALQSAFALAFGIIFAIENNSNPGEKRDRATGDLSGTINFESMGGFLAVRPIENTFFSKVILWTIAKSVMLACAMWLSVLLAVWLSMWLTKQFPISRLPPIIGAWFLPLNLLSPWICMANAASFAFLAHRAAKFVLAALGIMIGYLILTASIQVSREVIQQIHLVSVTILSALVVLLTFWVFHRCHRTNQLSQKTLILAVTIVCGIIIAAALLRPANHHFVVHPLTLAIAALSVLPFAAMPLTIGASRHR